MTVPLVHRLALSDPIVKAYPLKSKPAVVMIPWGSHGQVKTTVSSEASLPQVELLQGQQSLKLLVHMKQTGDKGSTVLDMAERSELQVCHALTVACHRLKQNKSWAVLISNSYLNQRCKKVVPLT